jgi:CofD-related protein of GAK system
VPDPVRIARSRRLPELGPRILFFTGGTALRATSRALKLLTHNSVHVVTPFDSGGSSARLREAFGMLSVGDLRNRIMALADETVRGHPEVVRLFGQRLPSDASPDELRAALDRCVEGLDPRIASVPDPMRRIVTTHLRWFAESMPRDFDLREASVGNLILAGGYLQNGGDVESVLFLFSRLVEARGRVLPVVEADLHLAAELEDGSRVVGQHRITGRDGRSLAAPIRDLAIVRSLEHPERVEPYADEKVRAEIERADLIVYPMGSFWTSVVGNLLPKGIGSAVAAAGVPKVYVPSTGRDGEQLGMDVGRAVATIARVVRRDAGAETPVEDIVDLVLVDRERGRYEAPADPDRLRALGVEVADAELLTSLSAPALDPILLAEALVSLA